MDGNGKWKLDGNIRFLQSKINKSILKIKILKYIFIIYNQLKNIYNFFIISLKSESKYIFIINLHCKSFNIFIISIRIKSNDSLLLEFIELIKKLV